MLNKVIKITCSFLLVLSLFNLNVFHVYADDENTYKDIQNDTSTETADSDAPEEISLQILEEENETEVMSGDESCTDRVDYVDVNGNPIENAPETIKYGKIEDHNDLNIEGRHFEFKSAKVGDLNCVYIGRYANTVYYSTDGIIAIKMEDDHKLVMMYQEYYNISFNEVIPDGGVAGTIIHDGNSVDTSQSVRVNAGQTFSFTVNPAQANKVRYKITSVKYGDSSEIPRDSGDEYGATYTASFSRDDVITITYGGEGVYRVYVKETNNEGLTCINTDKTHYTGTYINDFTFSESDLEGIDKDTITLPVFHVISSKRIVGFQLNGSFMNEGTASTGNREVPVSTANPITVRGSTSKGLFSVQIKLIDVGIGSAESNCNYGYQLTVKKLSGNWDDLNFTPTYGERRTQTLTLRIISQTKDGYVRGGDGAEVAVYNYSEDKADGLEVVHDNDVFSMNPTHLLSRKQVKFFFIKAKPGYSLSISGGRTSGVQQIYDTYAVNGTIDNLNANTLGGKNFTNFDNNWQNAKSAAIAKGYTHFLVMTGEEGNDGAASGLDWDLYVAQITASGGEFYAMYGKGDLPEGSVVTDMPESDMLSRSNKSNNNPYPNEPVFGVRNFGDSFTVGEKDTEPKCEGYRFAGWKLVNADGNSENSYQNGSVFTIDSSNVAYGNTKFVDTGGYSHNNAYRFVAQWEKISSKTVKVNHYLKVPDGTEKLEKITEGTITFANDGESVTAVANPEPDGTFPGYIFDDSDERNILEKTVINDSSTDTIELNLYYKPTVLNVSKTVTGYNLEPDREFTFTFSSDSSIGEAQVYIKNGETAKLLIFTDNKASFTLKKDESVEISCLPAGSTYTVTENDPGTNFKASYRIDGGDAVEGNIATFTMPVTGITNIQFTNTSTISPPVTGIRGNHSDTLPLTFIPVCIALILMACHYRRKFR